MLKSLDGSIISLLVLFLLLYHSKGLSGNKQNTIFRYMVLFNITLIIADLLTWFIDSRDGMPAYISLRALDVVIYALPIIPSILYTIYVYDLIQIDVFKKRRGLLAFFYVLIALNTVFTFLSLFNGWYFYIDENNAYYRGSHFYLFTVLSTIPFIVSAAVLIVNRRRFNKKYFYTLIIYYIPQTAGIIIQILFYGYTTNWIGMMLSLLIVYLNIQSQNLNTDYLTGVNNRRYLEETISAKIRHASDKKTFLAMMIDVDDFKLINDNFGHDIGDIALRDTAMILKNSIRNDDFVARSGGDEFIVLIDIDSSQQPSEAVKRIMENTDKLNKEQSRPYTLKLSAGYMKYDCKTDMKADELLRNIDRLMYENKKKRLAEI